MAGIAFRVAVFAGQRVIGFLVVIEFRLFPTGFGVAFLTLVAEAAFVAFVVVVLAMAGDALGGRPGFV